MSRNGYFCDSVGLYTLVNVFIVVVILYVTPLLIHLLLSRRGSFWMCLLDLLEYADEHINCRCVFMSFEY